VSDLGVFLGGEGANELGSYAGPRSYHDEEQPGVLTTLLRRVRPTGWHVVGATKWSRIRKLRARGPSPTEERNVRALILDAKEAKADVLAFTRDSDGDQTRERDIERTIFAHEAAKEPPHLIAAVAVPVLEAWLLALSGERGTEQLSKAAAQARFENEHHFGKATEMVVEYVKQADLTLVPDDAQGLARWLARADTVFAVAASASTDN